MRILEILNPVNVTLAAIIFILIVRIAYNHFVIKEMEEHELYQEDRIYELLSSINTMEQNEGEE